MEPGSHKAKEIEIEAQLAEFESLKIRFEKLKEAYIKLQQSVLSERIRIVAQMSSSIWLSVPSEVPTDDAINFAVNHAERLLSEIERRNQPK